MNMIHLPAIENHKHGVHQYSIFLVIRVNERPLRRPNMFEVTGPMGR